MDYYKIIGVDAKATQIEIKQAYHAKIKKYHPDKVEQTKENIAKYKLIRKAGDILCNNDERKLYDLQRRMDETCTTHETQKKLFKQFDDLQKNTVTEEQKLNAQNNFNKDMEALNKKHGSYDDKMKMTVDESARRVDDMLLFRDMEETEYETLELFKTSTFDNKKFNNIFEKIKQKPQNTDAITPYTNIITANNFDNTQHDIEVNQCNSLYAEYNGFSSSYGGLNDGTVVMIDDLSIDSLCDEYENTNLEEDLKKIIEDRKMDIAE